MSLPNGFSYLIHPHGNGSPERTPHVHIMYHGSKLVSIGLEGRYYGSVLAGSFSGLRRSEVKALECWFESNASRLLAEWNSKYDPYYSGRG